MRGKKIGVIGTGSSGIQATPILAEQAESLVVFQRSPNYTVPMPNYPWSEEDLQRIRREYPERRQRSSYAAAGTPHGTYHKNALDTDPAERDEAMWRALARRRGAVQQDLPRPELGARRPTTSRGGSPRTASATSSTDPAVAEDLIPTDHPIGTKRICTDAGYYATFNRDNVRLVNLRREPIRGDHHGRRSHGCGDIRVRRAGVRDGFRRADRRDDADRPDGSGRAPAVGDVGGRAA